MSECHSFTLPQKHCAEEMVSEIFKKHLTTKMNSSTTNIYSWRLQGTFSSIQNTLFGISQKYVQTEAGFSKKASSNIWCHVRFFSETLTMFLSTPETTEVGAAFKAQA